jgi:hypothetical protein
MCGVQQLPEDIDVPVVDVTPAVGHGTEPLGTTADRLCVVISGNGLSPPVVSSVDPTGIPIRAVVDREPTLGDDADAVALEAAVPLEQVPDAVPEMPAPSNSAVGADVPAIAPVADDSPLIAPVGAVELPAPPAEHTVADVVMPGVDGFIAVGLTPGVASSVAPIGMPVVPTAVAGPSPSGDVMPSGGVTGAMPTWAKAMPRSSSDQAMAAIKMPFMACILLLARMVRAANAVRYEHAGSGMRLKTDS